MSIHVDVSEILRFAPNDNTLYYICNKLILFNRGAIDVFVDVHCLIRICIFSFNLLVSFYSFCIFTLLFQYLASLKQIDRT